MQRILGITEFSGRRSGIERLDADFLRVERGIVRYLMPGFRRQRSGTEQRRCERAALHEGFPHGHHDPRGNACLQQPTMPSQNEGMAVLIGELQATCGQVSLIQL